MGRYNNKAHKDWRKAVLEKWDNKCAVCGATCYDGKKITPLHAHHLIAWEVEKFRYDINNGIVLCPRHHTKYGHQVSPHNDSSAMFFIILQDKYPEVWKWLKEKLGQFQKRLN